ncbi:secondary thiamine-phosphate synthase enzyme YjbQ [Breznakiella homolactica]|uniref:YjbQ family protein n=1 Tax=Breznakiella homolactica TaxID=2798577 RepID=A0A7T7XL82_9SPIR|nr:secondary thiamine-phosphate synthase enzyme YjbQ [Breznakiella homolactica]QQO08459.1 secondary thiamine-phosphate synthase enzyme YjbQ [Breznakiella homolactica]
MFKQFPVETQFNDVVSITDRVLEIVAESGVQNGTCIVYIPHSTASVTVTSPWDPRGFEDIQDEISRLIPTKVNFKHQHDTPQDAAGHVKSAIMGVSVSLIIDLGKLMLGSSQGIFFVEFDGPRKRQVYVKISSD